MQRSLKVNGVHYPVSVRVECRGSYRASIGARGVSIRLPSGMAVAAREECLERLLRWAAERLKRRPVRRYGDGQALEVAGCVYTLRLSESDRKQSQARLSGRIVTVSLPPSVASARRHDVVGILLSRCFARRHGEQFRQRVRELNGLHFGLSIGRITLRNNRSVWGSCSRSGNLSFATRLLRAPSAVVDYVVIHELAHRLAANHSPDFWTLVRRAMPDYEARRRWLRRHGQELDW